MIGIICDEFEMVINSTYGREHCTAFGKALLLDQDGKNYGLNKYCTWSSPSGLYQPNARNWSPSTLGKEKPKNYGQDDYLHFSQVGRKVLVWKSKVGRVCLTRFMIHARNNNNGACNADLPKDVTFTFKLSGVPIQTLNHTYGYRWRKYPKDQEKTEWVEFYSDGLYRFENEEEERIEWICDESNHFGDLKVTIPSSGQSMNLWKCFLLVNSEKFDQLNNAEEYKILETPINNHLDEKIILCLILQKRIHVPEDSLLDYFLFFQHFGLKREMLHIIHLIPKIEHFKTLYDLFFGRIYGSSTSEDQLKKFMKVVDGDQNGVVTEDSFETSFAHSLFLQMKDRLESQVTLLKQHPSIKKLVNFRWLRKYTKKMNVKKKPSSIDVRSHRDFKNIRFEDLEISKVLEKLFNNVNKKMGNMKLLSSDNKTFCCHKEILVLKYGYFMKMFGKNWAEREYLDKNKPIRIEGMESDVMDLFLQFTYNGFQHQEDNDVNNISLVVLVTLLIFSQMYISEKLKDFCLKKIDVLIKKEKEEDKSEQKIILSDELNDLVDRLAPQMRDNEDILKLIVPRLSTWSGVKESWVYQKIHIYSERKMRNLEIERLQSIIEEQKEVISTQGIDLEEMKKKNKEMTEKMCSLEEKINNHLLKKE